MKLHILLWVGEHPKHRDLSFDELFPEVSSMRWHLGSNSTCSWRYDRISDISRVHLTGSLSDEALVPETRANDHYLFQSRFSNPLEAYKA